MLSPEYLTPKKKGSFTAIIFIIIFLIPWAGCTTITPDVETPEGGRPGDQFGEFKILGISSRWTRTENLENAQPENEFIERVELNVPSGTELIIPAIRGWKLGYGEYIGGEWERKNEKYGLGWVWINVVDIRRLDETRTVATVTIHIRLNDDGLDDKWFGEVAYTLIYLGREG